MNLANAITLLRIVMVPLLIQQLLVGDYRASIGIFLIAGLSDALDGFIAKRFNQCTRLGSILDPLADKLLMVSSVTVLALQGRMPAWLALVIVARDLLIVGGATAFYRRAGMIEMAPSMISKLNTAVQVVTILSLLGQAGGLLLLGALLPFLFGLTLFTTLASGIHYVLVWSARARALRGAGQ